MIFKEGAEPQTAAEADIAAKETGRERNIVLLAQKARKGNRQALRELCRETAKGVLFRVRRYLPGCQDDEDVAQEVLLRVCRNIQFLKNPEVFNGWLNSIIFNEVRRYTARDPSRVGKLLYLDDYIDNIEEEDESLLPQEYSMRKEETGAMMEIIDTLPRRQRQAVMLHYYDNMSVTEAAKVMEVTHQGVSLYLKLAQEKVREQLQNREKSALFSALSMLPAGSLMAEALRLEAKMVFLSSDAFAAKAISGCAKAILAGSLAAKAALLPNFAAGIAALLVTVGISAAVLMPHIPSAGTLENPLPLPPEADPAVVYSGADTVWAHLNPQRAEARTNNEQEFVPVGWVITPLYSGEVLRSGSGGTVEQTFGLLPGGVYRLTFTLEDAAGRVYTLFRNFQIGLDGI